MDTPPVVRRRERPAPSAASPVLRSLAGSERQARIFKALAHPVRVEIVSSLAACAGACCGDIVRGLPLAQSTVSQHLAILRDAGLIEMRGEGRCCRYRLAGDARALVEAAIRRTFAAQACGDTEADTEQAPAGACRKDTE